MATTSASSKPARRKSSGNTSDRTKPSDALSTKPTSRRASSKNNAPAADEPGLACNMALVIGELVTEPETRTLTGGVELFSFSLTVRQEGVRTTSVPLTWFDPPPRVRSWKLGSHIAATGPVVRRFYRAGAGTGARTEVSVTHAELLTRRAAVRRFVGGVADHVESALGALD